ncbi:MAG: alpha-glucan family phosphorylase [Candidatus Dojkabacteria bacterium]
MQDLIKIKSNFHDQDSSENLAASHSSVFRSYDVRGIYPDQLDLETVYKIAKAFCRITPGENFLLAVDMRSSSFPIAKAIATAIKEEGRNTDFLGESTTDKFYFAVGNNKYDGGAMITASHNSAIFNGVKFVKKGAAPVEIPELKEAFDSLEGELNYLPNEQTELGQHINIDEAHIEHVLKFAGVKPIRKLKIVVDAGNGMAGAPVEKLLEAHPKIELVKMYFEPHADFPHHEANPALEANLVDLQQKVREEGADLGAAFDGDGDRIFFVDHKGEVVPGYYMMELLSEYLLGQNKGEAIVYDTRGTFALESITRLTGARGVVSKAGHTFVKKKMRDEDALFGGETTSSHYYYRDNYYADSGLITLQIVLKILTETEATLDDLIKSYREKFFISGEKNFYLADMDQFQYLQEKLKNEFSNGSFSDFDGLAIEGSDWRFSLRQSATEPFIRLNVEAFSQSRLQEVLASLFNIIQDFAKFTGEISNMYTLKTLHMDKKEKLEFLYSNAQFTWNTSKGNYLDDLYGRHWSRNESPLDVLRQIDQPYLDDFYEKNSINIENSVRIQETYLKKETWFERIAKHDPSLAKLNTNPIAYFSLEFGIADWLQIYSGGLGVLAGDTVKEASDSGLPMIAIGLFYTNGYFYQRFTDDGWQLEDYLTQDFDDYPIETVKDEKGYTITVEVNIAGENVKVRGWRMKIGRRSLILLDTNFEENRDMEHRMITYHLYGGDQDTRIRQEQILAIGGYKLLKTAGIRPSILHLNEGHSAFTVLAQAQDIMSAKGVDFAAAIEESRKNILFTNHTLKQAGNDVFDYELVENYLGPYAKEMNVDFNQIFSLGVDSQYADGKFGMTIMGLNNAEKINAVSILHAKAAKSIWPDHPLIPVTNGVHMPTWVSEPIHHLLDHYVSERWSEQGARVDWDLIDKIPNEQLWEARKQAKRKLLENIKFNCRVDVPEDSLIFGWFRRLTAYKQPEILILDPERLAHILNSTDRPVRFIFGGKAHPRDEIGKKHLQEIYQMSMDPKFKGKLIIVPDYNWRMARYMVSGSDVWINSPIRYQEACGTSGMKAAANGLIQFSTIDGWVDEIKDENIVWDINHELESMQYYDTIEKEIVPLFHERDEKDVPHQWLERAKKTMKIALSHYGTDRMLREYIEKLYKPLL